MSVRRERSLASFTSPLEGEVDRAQRDREGGHSQSDLKKLPPSLTLPLKGGGDKYGAAR